MQSFTKRVVAYKDLEGFLKHPQPPASYKYRYPIQITQMPAEQLCRVEVVQGDTLDIAKRIKDNGTNPLILNMACATHPGGGWKRGAAAQEESLFYRSTYYKTLTHNYYPILGAEIIYSTGVTVFRDSFLKETEPWTVDFMAVAAIKDPIFNSRLSFTDYYDLTSKKIELMFQLGIAKGYESLLLSAFGCGAYHNDPKIIVEIFNTMIQKYGKYFKTIYFGILSIDEVQQRYYGTPRIDNYKYFSEAIEQLRE